MYFEQVGKPKWVWIEGATDEDHWKAILYSSVYVITMLIWNPSFKIQVNFPLLLDNFATIKLKLFRNTEIIIKKHASVNRIGGLRGRKRSTLSNLCCFSTLPSPCSTIFSHISLPLSPLLLHYLLIYWIKYYSSRSYINIKYTPLSLTAFFAFHSNRISHVYIKTNEI